ncbi:TetR/AcrR family transcriptional regulator [Ideonella livida]|uniref:TetR/AcrR family transcriptional regulator n=1 Tax=Ideonella livida TaxID=2707176 RepID=A0A7C9PFM0_9BURK|nr:TetR/AcrR family transcriptional regulator [Ideonella livida]NDY90232.1 TetR/AcrR family transcriptional regulator [Ideonella livida]
MSTPPEPPAPGTSGAASVPAASPRAGRRPPASAKSEQRVRDLLRVGREVLAEKGYERATTTEIAQRLGISEATVFTYFSGKRALCVQVISDWYDEIIQAMEAGLDPQASTQAQLLHLVRTHLRLFLQQGTGLCALVLSEGRSKGQDLGETFQPLQRRYTAPLMAVLARGQARGELRQDVSLRLMRATVLGPMEHLLWEVVGQSRPLDDAAIDATARSLVQLLWPALAAPQAELAALRQLREDVAAALARSG